MVGNLLQKDFEKVFQANFGGISRKNAMVKCFTGNLYHSVDSNWGIKDLTYCSSRFEIF